MQDIMQRVDALPEFLAPIKDAAKRYIQYPGKVGGDGVLDIGHRPWVAELNYVVKLYPGIERDKLHQYAKHRRVHIPEMYAEVLRYMNGAFCFGMSLCGVPGSMLGNRPLLDRSILQCHDLATAALLWIDEYNVPDGFFHFGGRHYSFSKNAGYFIDGNERIVCVLGKKKIIGEWTSFESFLSDELQASEKLEEERHPPKWNVQR